MQIQTALTGLLLSFLCDAGNASRLARTPAEQAIARAEIAIESSPDDARGYDRLALALARRARETADSSYYEKAHEALAQAAERNPEGLETRKVTAWVLLGEHRFAEAEELADELREQVPDDVSIYGYQADAAVELGKYAKAEQAVQWMLDLHPGNVPALTRAAYLRELFGDVSGAVELMGAAYTRIHPRELEDRAWVLTHLAQLEVTRGNLEDAEAILAAAQELFPDYHYALAAEARLHEKRGDLQQAVDLRRKHVELAPHPENVFELAAVLHRAGELEEASVLFQTFEEGALAESESVDNANRELVRYYLDFQQGREAEALRISSLERARRADVFTREAHAWALFANGSVEEAREEIEAAIEIGVRDDRMLYRAGVIFCEAGDLQRGEAFLEEALSLGRGTEVAELAASLLEGL